MGRTDTASRVVEASAERVFAALTDPDALLEWLPPAGMTGRFDSFDLRPGGSYRMVLTYADAPAGGAKSSADSDVVECRFTDIVPGVRIVEESEFTSDDPAFSGTMTLTWTLTEVDAGTRVDIRADDVPEGISADDHVAGMNSSLQNLADHLGRR
jgi:uncharacterized protein YndB with AHSA1/START domain